MDPVSLTASAIAFVDATTKLAHGCLQLYQFWESVRDAPAEVNTIKNDLQILTKILEEIGDDKALSPSVRSALGHCQVKLDELLIITQQLDTSYATATSRRQRLWTAFRITTKHKQFQSFREGLHSIKSTLMLGLACQNIQRPSLCFTNNEVLTVRLTARTAHTASDAREQIKIPMLTKVDPKHGGEPTQNPQSCALADKSFSSKELTIKNRGYAADIIASSPRVQAFLQHSLHLAVDDLFKSGTVEQLMSDAVDRVTSFDCISRDSYGEDRPETENAHRLGEERSSTGRCAGSSSPLLKKARVCYRTSSMGVLFGSIWIRTSTLKVENEATVSSGQAEVITSFIFYPSHWLSWFGFRSGTEANLRFSPEAGWKFNITPFTAVPETSLIFDLCRIGDVSGVKLLLSRRDASVKDTSPKGWTPLHFAASSGHVELCSALIEAGADMTAIAYEGPSENALSPVAMWAELCQNASAADKIRMMRVFYECLDQAEAGGEGWVVIHALVSSMSYENVPMQDTGVNWLLRRAESGMLVGMGAATVWDGLQHAVRGALFQEHEHLSLHRHLGLDSTKPEFGTLSHVTALSNLIVIRICSRMLLPMLIEAAVGVGVDGFDTPDDYKKMTRRHLVRGIPELYVTWCRVLPRIFETMESLIETELGLVLNILALDRDILSERIRLAALELRSWNDGKDYRCSECSMSYANIGAGLVYPRRISFEECRKTKHKLRCQCAEYLQGLGISPRMDLPSDGIEWEEAEEELCSGTIEPLEQFCQIFDECYVDDSSGDPFHFAILTLYQTQGRRWLGGAYEPTERLCGTCFFKREQYLGPDGSAKWSRRFTPVPESFVAWSNRAATSTF